MFDKTVEYLGRKNPNCRYKLIDDRYFKIIDTEIKAYILGWIISDGSIRDSGWSISVHRRDMACLKQIASKISNELPVKSIGRMQVKLTVNSKTMAKDLRELLSVSSGPKAQIVQMPTLKNRQLQLACIRGIFEGDGHLTDPLKNKKSYLQAGITTSSKQLRKQISTIINIPHYNFDDRLEWSCNNALDFLGLLYENANYYMRRKHDLYKCWCQFVPGLGGYNMSCYASSIKCLKTRKDALLPSKIRISDTGYDLTIVEKIKQIGDVSFYTTGIKVQPPIGWATEIRARSSIAKTGYMLANGVGTIDRSYLGEIIIALRKVDKSAVNIELPCRIAQMIPVPVVHLEVVEVSELSDTSRGAGGFGSTGEQ